MPQNPNFRKTRLPETLPKLDSIQSHLDKGSKKTLEHVSTPSTDTRYGPEQTTSDSAIRNRPSSKGTPHISSHDILVSKIVKLPVEKTDSEESDVLRIDGQRYDKILTMDQAGRGILSMEDSDKFPLVFIKERKRERKIMRPLRPFSHMNIIALRAVFYHADSISMVYDYEVGAMTLASVASCPSVKFSDADIATVSRDILHALQFVHWELKIAHGDVRDGNILLTLSGDVKLANTGDSMLNDVTLKDRDCDLKAVGTMAMNLVDRTTKIVKPDVVHWKFGASAILREFISKTSEESVKNLLKHEFLQLAAPSWSLKPHLMKALNFDPTFRRLASSG